MGEEYTVTYERHVVTDDIPKLARNILVRIRAVIEEKLTTQPQTYGKHLRKSLKGYRKLRVGDYRVVFRIEAQVVKVFAIAHRRHVYKMLERRVSS